MLTLLETKIIKRINEIKLDNCSLDCISLVLIQCCSLIVQGFTLCKEECDKLSNILKKYE